MLFMLCVGMLFDCFVLLEERFGWIKCVMFCVGVFVCIVLDCVDLLAYDPMVLIVVDFYRFCF